jgi:hypothetical protein
MDTQAVTIFQETVKYSGRYIFIKPICDYFGLDYKYQSRVIGESPNLKKRSSHEADKSLFGDERDRICLTKRGFLFWTTQLNPELINTEFREKFILFQESAFDFFMGSEVDEEISEAKILRRDELRVIEAQKLQELKEVRKELKALELELAPSIRPRIIQVSLFDPNPERHIGV